MTALEKLQTRIAGLERAQASRPSRDRAERIAHHRTSLRRFRETIVRNAHAATRSPFPNS